MVLTYEKRENKLSMLLKGKVPRRVNRIVREELKQLVRDQIGSPQNYLRFYYNVLRRHDILKTDKTKEETLITAINLLKRDHPEFNPKVNWDFFDFSKYETEKGSLLSEIRLKAESLQKKKKRKAAILSVLKGGSALMLFLALGLLQFNFPLYLFFVITGCIILGLSTFWERRT